MRGTSMSRAGRAWGLATAGALLSALLLVPATPTLGAAAPCSVKNLGTGAGFGSLQKAIAKASKGATLQLTGVCKEPVTFTKNLTLVGKRTKATGKPTIDGAARTHAVVIAGGRIVTMRGLTIRNGAAVGVDWPGNAGGGIFNAGKLTLVRVVVEKNTALQSGGGIRNEGKLTLTDSIVRNNIVEVNGDGCGVTTSTGITMTGGRIAGNHPLEGAYCFGGGLAMYGGDGLLKGDATIANNRAGSANGGGLEVYGADTTLTMQDSVAITGNTTTASGGGVFVSAGTFTLLGGTITGNTAASAAGIFGNCGTIDVATPVSNHVFGNTPDADQVLGVC